MSFAATCPNTRTSTKGPSASSFSRHFALSNGPSPMTRIVRMELACCVTLHLSAERASSWSSLLSHVGSLADSEGDGRVLGGSHTPYRAECVHGLRRPSGAGCAVHGDISTRMSILSSYKHCLEGATVPMARGSVEVVGQAELRDTPGWRTIRVVAREGRRVIPEECSIGRAGVENKQRGERVAGPRRCRELGVCIRIHE
ncbi:hypothetical protein FOMPIDRAFT_1020814 [Fomitopsis schrenkii]|uniref:Uncharacterized protein n=1 Tax=Fomitopsis schrenkii TaxID=2126942 RepID=S8DNN8_FOMSC|nr:hypothetical protein FOMPIDRAFT_1020814 [Fomitopsis schrenkii]